MLRGPHRPDCGPHWVGQGQLEAHHLLRAARGPGWGAEASQGVEGGLPGHILGGLPGGRESFPVGVLGLQLSTDSAGYHRGLSVRRKDEGETEAHTQGTLLALISPDTPSPYSPRYSVPLGLLPGHQAGLAFAHLLPGIGVVVSCWQGGSVRREGGPGLGAQLWGLLAGREMGGSGQAGPPRAH